MEIQLIQIEAPDCVEFPELRKRAVESPKSKITTHYRVLADGVEVAFVSLDRWQGSQAWKMVIYEIFVRQAMRRRGFASAALVEVEKVAFEEGFPKMRLRPSPLDHETSRSALVEWYHRRGYDWDPVITGEMEKTLE